MVATVVLSGCASRVTAPVRDGAGAPSATPQVAAGGLHVVRPGDTLLGIARQYGQTVPNLVAWNGLSDPNQIHVGQSLRVAPPGAGDGGEVATAIPIAPGGVTMTPVAPGASDGAAVPIKQAPLGGRQPYSDEAWAKLRPNGMAQPPVAPAADTVGPAQGTGDWLWPAKGKAIAGFNESTNKGVDIAGNPGDPVYAAAAGKVVYAGSGLRGYGKLVVIKHNQEYNSVYAHNQKLLVKEDDVVAKGQQIAELGNTEADRPKLHFEIRKQGKAVDPMKYLPAR
ncbi:MAG: LysM peptidoglycan-binding domain-containing protein [Betaproteobacteria bacterium]|nr:MAG: LysM peptidoglycan-binding domain-containing protein [Betaproteobacteria bacterium]